jgi:predicted MFS family arabinose efflux permease
MSPLDSLANSITVRMASRYHLDFGMMTFWGAVAFTATNFLGAIIWPLLGFQWIYLAGGVLYLVVSVVASTLDEPLEEAAACPEVNATGMKGKRKLNLKPWIVVFLAVYFLFSFAFFNAFNFTAPILASRGVSELAIGLLGTIIGVGAMIVRLKSNVIYQRVSIEAALIAAIITGILPIIAYGFIENIIILMLVSILRGAGWGLFSLSSIKYLDSQASVENASTLQSLMIMLSTFSGIISNPISGMLFDTNMNLIFYISLGVALISLVLMVIVYRMQSNQGVLAVN